MSGRSRRRECNTAVSPVRCVLEIEASSICWGQGTGADAGVTVEVSGTILGMRITVRFFAILKDRAGCAEALLELPDGATVGGATDAISRVFPAISGDLKRCAAAINREYAPADQVLSNNDELALIPPVSGGIDS